MFDRMMRVLPASDNLFLQHQPTVPARPCELLFLVFLLKMKVNGVKALADAWEQLDLCEIYIFDLIVEMSHTVYGVWNGFTTQYRVCFQTLYQAMRPSGRKLFSDDDDQ